MEITGAMLKDLREKSGAGIVDCKQALQETNGDMDKAVEILRKKGMSKAEKSAGRAAKEGTVAYKLEGKKGLVLKVNCETDFVAKADGFQKFVTDALELIYKKGYAFTTELPEDLEALRKDVIAKYSENILLSDWKFIESKGELFPFLHKDRFTVKVATIADFSVDKKDEETEQLMKNITMQVTAMNPMAVDVASFPKEAMESLKKEYLEEAKASGKPEKILENIVKGKLDKYFTEVVLMEQAFILDEEKKVKDVIGSKVKVNGFVRVAL